MKEIYDKTHSYMEDLRILSNKYENYRRAVPAEIPFRAPQNDVELQQVKGMIRGGSIIVYVVTLAFILMTVFAFATGQIKGGVISLIMTIVVLFFCIKMVMGKPEVAYGNAIWKNYRQSNVAQENTKTFFFSVIFEQPERIVVQEIQTSREDFDNMYEGVPVILAKKGNVIKAKIYR